MSSIKSMLTNFFAKKSYIDILLIALGIKMCLFATTFGDSLIILWFLGYKCFVLWDEKRQLLNIDADTRKEISDMKNVMAALGMKHPSKASNEVPKRLF